MAYVKKKFKRLPRKIFYNIVKKKHLSIFSNIGRYRHAFHAINVSYRDRAQFDLNYASNYEIVFVCAEKL